MNKLNDIKIMIYFILHISTNTVIMTTVDSEAQKEFSTLCLIKSYFLEYKAEESIVF